MRGEEGCAGGTGPEHRGEVEAEAFEVGFRPNGPNGPGGGDLLRHGVI